MLSIPNWICLDCKKLFKPSISDDGIDINCPSFGSYRTVAHREKQLDAESDNDWE